MFWGWTGTPGAGLGLLRASRGRCRELTRRWEDGTALGVTGPDSWPSISSSAEGQAGVEMESAHGDSQIGRASCRERVSSPV